MMPCPTRRAVTCLLVAVVIPLAAACSQEPAGHAEGALTLPGGTSSGAGITQDHVAIGQSATFGDIMICGAGIGTRVTSVSLVDVVGDMALANFAVRPNRADGGVQPIGAGVGTLQELVPGLNSGPALAEPCVGRRGGSELLVEITRVGPADACARGGIDVYFQDVPSGSGTLRIPLALGVSGGAAVLPCP